MENKKYYVGQKLMNSPFDTVPSFEIVNIFHTMADDRIQYRIKDIHTGKLQITSEDFLYPCDL